jgi:AhpD family alkylhydroperoxidase
MGLPSSGNLGGPADSTDTFVSKRKAVSSYGVMSIETPIQTTAAVTAQPRLNYGKASPAAYQAMFALQTAVNKCGLEKSLMELVKVRASLLNGCAFCIDMHFREAKAAGEREERLYLLSAWEETHDLYTAREKAALRWTDALTKLAGNPVSDELFDEVRGHFTDEEMANLTLVIVAINGWNRFSVGFGMPIRFQASNR